MSLVMSSLSVFADVLNDSHEVRDIFGNKDIQEPEEI